jgi:hypothetical protein
VLIIPLLLVSTLFFWLGWKARGIFEYRPRWLKWAQKKRPETGLNGTPSEQKGGIIDRLSRGGERIVGKGIETIFGKPKGPKDDEEE